MIIKPANEHNEFTQIHALNYLTFVEEIPQHPQNDEHRLIDKFHDHNNYIIAKRGEQVIGMVSYNWERPFSLDSKMDNLDSFLPSFNKIAEIRLLSVIPAERKTGVAYRLLKYLCHSLIEQNIDTGVISGTTRQLKLYQRMGFIPFGPLVGKPGAFYQPMYITLKDLRDDFRNS